jgi:LAO/AO transport system kinase
MTAMTLTASLLSGDRLALARLLSQVENDTPEGRTALNELFPFAGRAHRIGVTGAPGTGKSSLVNQLAHYYRKPSDGETTPRVAIVAIDPTSPFTGGAILGDRVRMRDLAGDPGIFIRSMASRGSLGGLAATTSGIVQIFDAAGFDIILIETVGAGQTEVDIARLAHTTLVVEAPGQGDDIQTIKAGILEIADVLVVNTSDLPGADNTERLLRSMLELAHPVPHVFHHRRDTPPGDLHTTGPDVEHSLSPSPFWVPPIQRSVATQGSGIPDLAAAIVHHRTYLQQTGEWQQRERSRLQSELDTLLEETLVTRWRLTVPEENYRSVLAALTERRLSPYQAVESLLSGARSE